MALAYEVARTSAVPIRQTGVRLGFAREAVNRSNRGIMHDRKKQSAIVISTPSFIRHASKQCVNF